MSVLAFLIGFVLIILAIVRKLRRKPAKKLFIGWIICSVIFVGTVETEEPKEETKTEQKKEKVVEVKEEKTKKEEVKRNTKEDQDKVTKFYDDIVKTDNTFQTTWDKSQTALKSNDVYKAYETLSQSKNEADRIWKAFHDIEIPKQLDEKTTKLLEEGKENMSTAYFVKIKGIEGMQKFLDDQKPSVLQEAKDNMQQSEIFQLEAAVKFLQAKESVGIKE